MRCHVEVGWTARATSVAAMLSLSVLVSGRPIRALSQRGTGAPP